MKGGLRTPLRGDRRPWLLSPAMDVHIDISIVVRSQPSWLFINTTSAVAYKNPMTSISRYFESIFVDSAPLLTHLQTLTAQIVIRPPSAVTLPIPDAAESPPQ